MQRPISNLSERRLLEAGRLAVTVADSHSDDLFVLDAENDNALDVFYHPYAHAASQAAARRRRRRPLATHEPTEE